jgi:hypothetical protein
MALAAVCVQTRFITPELFLNAPGNVALTTAPNNRFTSAFYAPFTKKVNADRSLTDADGLPTDAGY